MAGLTHSGSEPLPQLLQSIPLWSMAGLPKWPLSWTITDDADGSGSSPRQPRTDLREGQIMAISSPNGWPLSGSSGGSSDASDITSGPLITSLAAPADLSATGGTGQVSSRATTGAITVAAPRATTAGITPAPRKHRARAPQLCPLEPLVDRSGCHSCQRQRHDYPPCSRSQFDHTGDQRRRQHSSDFLPASGDNLEPAPTRPPRWRPVTATFVAYDSTNWKALV